MPIQTLDLLTEVSPGAQVKVGDIWWSRVDEGFRNDDGDVVPVEHFSGAVSAGYVFAASEMPPQAGELWEPIGMAGRAAMLILDVDNTTEQVHYLLFDFDLPHAIQHTALTAAQNWRRVSDNPVWLPQVAAFATLFNRHRVTYERVARERDELYQEALRLRQGVTFPDGFVAGIHDLLGLFDDEDDQARVNEYLNEFGVARESEHESEVTISGTSYLILPIEDVQARLDSGVTVTDASSVEVSWRKQVQVTRSGIGCTCGDIYRESLAEYLPENVDEWDFTASCAG